MKERTWPLLPQSILNNLFLTFPSLYKLNFIKFESGLRTNYGIKDLMEMLENVLNIEGNIIECGSDRCGTSVIMANYLKKRGIDKRIYALDLFGGGFEVEELQEERSQGLTEATDQMFRYNSHDYVKNKIERLGLEEIIIPVKGSFKDTLPHINSTFCLCLIDCDLRKSMVYSAETVWPKLSNNGVMLFDDYGSSQYRGVKIVVDAFVKKYGHEISKHTLLNGLYSVTKN